MIKTILLTTTAILASCFNALSNPDYKFDGTISRAVLDNYLHRSVTHAGLCASSGDPTTEYLDDDIRMLRSIGAKFIGRAAFVWDLPPDDEAHFIKAKQAATKVHQADPEIIIQCCIFEVVASGVSRIPVPAWVFTEFDLPVEKRNFRYNSMLFDNAQFHNHWRGGSSVPDMSKLETRMWFYYRARRYIDCGMEAIHFGQVMLMDKADPGHKHWIDILQRIRGYAKKCARRHLVICDAHTHGTVEDGKLLFDFHSFPLRIREHKDKPQTAYLTKESAGDIFGRSKGGIAPCGWKCDSAPYLIEFDNYGYSGRGGQSVGEIWVWGYDEISWFAHQSEEYRNEWLQYAYDWIKKNAPNGHLQMPCRRTLAAPLKNGVRMFSANNRSDACPEGFNVESTIKAIWQEQSHR